MEAVKRGENVADVAGSRFAVGVLADFPGCAHALSQRLTKDVNSNWSVISQNLYGLKMFLNSRASMHALVVAEIQKIENEALKLFSVCTWRLS